MIRFALHCDKAHSFEIWFRSNDDYEQQRDKKLIHCPHCHSSNVEKLLMAPMVATARKREQTSLNYQKEQGKLLQKLQKLSKFVRKHADYVGASFTEEARKIHFGETKFRTIYGEASTDEVASLIDDGIHVLPLIPLPEDQN